MLKIFLINRLNNVSDSILLRLLESKDQYVGGLFQKIETKNFKNLIQFVTTPGESDYLMIPHNYFSICKNKKYLKEIENLTNKFGKKVIVFAYGDNSCDLKIKNAIVLRTSKYKSKLLKNEIIIPAFVEDLGLMYGIKNRNFDKNTNAVVGFAGWVSCSSLFQWSKYALKLVSRFILLKLRIEKSGAIHQGIYFRRKVVSVLKKDSQIDSKFFLRSSYSGHKNTIEDDPKKIREQFVSSIKDSDLALAIKGDGNYSLRFFEILSLGRIPLLIDTDTPLPLEDEIDYDAFILRVDYRKIHKLPKIINEFWQNMTEEKFIEMQKKARQAFDYRLSAAAFYRYLFDNFDDIVKAHEGDIWGHKA